MESTNDYIYYDSKHTQAWLDSLKIALLEQNEEATYELIQHLPFEIRTTNEKNLAQDEALLEYLQTAKELIAQSITLLESKKEETLRQLEKIRNAKKFLLL
ncbi:hypothetical protein CQA66_08925 [Helicobacter aurati]|uniref:PH domain-containing protein n=1 Tax=Helicobacter aurati TaxID=137778 RepID=A0A3D8IVV3_9HELI|nr:hypothetical protein [Helicobacter aurati]RDU69409.1 hypothetical protein CQA66_08925 [Helicobacter aurati]